MKDRYEVLYALECVMRCKTLRGCECKTEGVNLIVLVEKFENDRLSDADGLDQ